MSHTAIIGATNSGKSFLAKYLCEKYHKSGMKTFVLHKELEPWKHATFGTYIPELFLHKVFSEKSAAVFMELSDAFVDKYSTAFHRLFSQGRHWGHKCHFISQRGASVHPNIRKNCTELYLFFAHKSDAKVWAEELADDKLLYASMLPRFCYLHKKDVFSPCKLCKLTI